MLKLLRNKKTAKKIWIVLGIIILPAFVFWGFSGVLSGRENQQVLGKINGKNITVEDFKNSLTAVKNMALMQYGEKLPEVEKELNLEAQAWQRLVLLSEAKKMKISTSDREVIKLIRSYPFFQYRGNFSDKVYNEVLRYVFKTQPRIFEEEVRQGITISKLFRKVTEDTTLSEEELKEGYVREKTLQDKKFKFNEQAFISEKKEFGEKLLQEKKQKRFLEYLSKLLK